MSDPAHRVEVSQIMADASHTSLEDNLKTWDLCMKIKAFVPARDFGRCAWWQHVEAQGLAAKYGVKTEPPADRP